MLFHIRYMVYLREVLQEMKKLDEFKNPIPFSIKVRSLNKQNRTGGKVYFYENATLLQQPRAKKEEFEREPNHFVNKTRNIKLENGKIKKISILFIIEFNGQKVIY